MGVFYRLFGSELRVAAVVNAVVSALVPVLTWILAQRVLSPNRAKLAGILTAAHPGLVLYAALVMTEPLSALSTLLAFVLATQGKERRWFVLGALALGLSALVRPQALLCAPALAFADSAPSLPKLRLFARAPAALAACVLALLPVLPWTARNCKVMDGCALVSTNAGWNLAIGAFPRATGRFETLKADDGCKEVTGQVQQDRCWFEYGTSEIKAHPGHWLGLIPKKLGYTFDHESFAVEYLHEARPSAWPEERRSLGRAITTYAHRLLMCAAALGVCAFVVRRRRREIIAQGLAIVGAVALFLYAFTPDPSFWPLAVYVAFVPWLPLPGRPDFGPGLKMALVLFGTTLVTHAIFFGEDRYHVVLTPVLCLLAAGALRSPARGAAPQSHAVVANST